MAARDPGEECRGDAEYSEYQFGTDFEGKLEFCFIRKGNFDYIFNITKFNLFFIYSFQVRKSLESLSSLINGKRDSPAKGIDSAMKT